ncbi:tail protein [Salmonella phage vB-SalM-SJ2]|uniref:Tail spike TSP1/Gp66 N-terminal domain-containing protein n=1 Tax=Salmonella phage vB-SalM-SJ2 TaxID=1458849 RepID=W8JPQ4_9CAUD|nr:tail protein [Salmonella phage vB-SalM-SJ2]AHK61504.1 hypothetical protein [Salmonella phage vB-SalM-SJ2]
MNELFSQGGKGSTGILTNKQAVARHFGVKQSEVVYFSVGAVLSGYKVIYDKESQRAYSLPTDLGAGTTAVSLSSSAVLVHSAGSVDLGALAVTREEYVTLPGSFDSGVTVNTKNELVVFTDGKYRWDGAFPKSVPVGSTPASTGGIGLGAWVSIGDASLRSQINNSFSDVVSLRNSKNLLPSIPVQLSNYYASINGGGGQFYVDDSDTTSTDNGGTVFVNLTGQRIKRVLDGVCRWSDFGILPGMPSAPTKSQCEAVWAWGFANGCKRYETFQKGEMTFTFPLLFQIPADWTGGAVSFIAEGLHKFAYDFTNGATDDVVEIILKLEDLSGNTPIHTIYNFDNVGMGRFPGKSIRYTALRHTNAKNSMIKVTGKNNYGYALFIGGSDNSIVYNSTFYNCDGQLLVTSPAGAYDNFGDAIYVGAKNVSIQSPVIETTQGGRAGIVFEGTSVDRVGGEVTNCFIKGYDRGIHIETVGYRMDAVNITGGRIQDCNTSVLAFNGVTADMSSDMSVIIKGLTSRLDSTISGHANPSGFSLGHLMVSGVNTQVTTEGCSWQAHQNNITVVGNGKWVSNGDRMFVNSGGINLPYHRGCEINNMYAPANRSLLNSLGNIIFTNSFWGGDISIGAGNKSIIDNVEMSKLTYPNCGRISLLGSNSAILRNITFQTPDTWAIDNTQTLQVPVCPIIENIHVNSTPTGTATLLRNAENTGTYANRYRRAMPSYISNGSAWDIIS